MRIRRLVLAVFLILSLAVAAYAGWTRVQSAEASAEENSSPVWIALLKGLSGEVSYVGSDNTHAYFRLGSVFWSYYKVRSCDAQVPDIFPVDRGTPYVVQLHVSGGRIDVFSGCPNAGSHPLGKLNRKLSANDAQPALAADVIAFAALRRRRALTRR